jgi:hypothetical protein
MRKIFFTFLKISILWPFTFYSDPALAYCESDQFTEKTGQRNQESGEKNCPVSETGQFFWGQKK